jgi:hypothetical protein
LLLKILLIFAIENQQSVYGKNCSNFQPSDVGSIPFVAEYTDSIGKATMPATEEMNTIFPFPDAFRSGCAS